MEFGGEYTGRTTCGSGCEIDSDFCGPSASWARGSLVARNTVSARLILSKTLSMYLLTSSGGATILASGCKTRG